MEQIPFIRDYSGDLYSRLASRYENAVGFENAESITVLWVTTMPGGDVTHTDIKQAPWYVVEADNKRRARLNCISHLLSLFPYGDLTPEPIRLPPRQSDSAYVRPPQADQTHVPEKY